LVLVYLKDTHDRQPTTDNSGVAVNSNSNVSEAHAIRTLPNRRYAVAAAVAAGSALKESAAHSREQSSAARVNFNLAFNVCSLRCLLPEGVATALSLLSQA